MDKFDNYIEKLANISPLKVTSEDLEKINKLTLDEVKEEDVFTFKATMADNEDDDRNYMPFNLNALEDLKGLYIGKTMLKDHRRSADSQVARIYDTELVTDESKTTGMGEHHTELVAKIYMIRTESNKDLIAEIIGGIKKEVSTSTYPKKLICSICGKDNMKDYCIHWPGSSYHVNGENNTKVKKTCMMIFDGCNEAYELSFVAVPAQPRAGAHKAVDEAIDEINEKKSAMADEESKKMDLRILEQRIKNAESFFN